jgi:hypothetical protein
MMFIGSFGPGWVLPTSGGARLWVFFAGGVWWAFGSWAPPSFTAFLMRVCEAVARLDFPVA